MTGLYLVPLVNASNNLLVSQTSTLPVILNLIQQVREGSRLNHRHNSFKTSDFRLHPSNPPCNRCTPLCQSHPHMYIKPINHNSHQKNPFHRRLNSNTLHTIINRHTHISLRTDLSMHMNPNMHMRINSGPRMNSNSLHINLHTNISLHTDISMHMHPTLHQKW